MSSSTASPASIGGVVSAGVPRPIPPVDGFQLQFDFVVPVTYSDGYGTYGSLVRPTISPPVGGWPVVVFVHPMGASRGVDLEFQMIVASQGYASWSYDVRGQGQAMLANIGHANAGSTLWGAAEQLDLAEQISFVAENPAYVGVADASRVAVIGRSQGAAHAWFAAALAGKPVTAPGRPTRTFPNVRCVAAYDLVADPIDDWLRGGDLFSTWFLEAINPSFTAVPIDPTFLQLARTAFLNQDPAAFEASLLAGGRPRLPSLALSAVPVLYTHAYRDMVNSALSGVQALEQRPDLQRSVLGGVGHNVPTNIPELKFRRVTTLRWFHRYLWDESNEVDLEPPHVLQELPSEKIMANNTHLAWSRTPVSDLRPSATAKKLFLLESRALSVEPPREPGIASVTQAIQPTVAGFSPATYLNDPAVRELANVLAACPLSEVVYCHVIETEQQMSRSALLHVTLVPYQPAWQLTATLTMQYGHMSHEVLLAGNTLASRNSTAGVPEDHKLRLPPVAVRFPAGAIVRLHLRSLALRQAPMLAGLDVTPMFHDFQVDVLEGPAGDHISRLELALEPVAPQLVADRVLMQVAHPMPIELALRGGTARAHHIYLGMVGLSGQTPGTPFYGTTLPVEFDSLVGSTAGSSKGMFTGGIGPLDEHGNATMNFDMTSMPLLPQFLNGSQLTFAAFVWDWTGQGGAASNAWDVMLL